MNRFQPPTEPRPGRYVKCHECGGEGWCSGDGWYQNLSQDEECAMCDGTGEIDTAEGEDAL